MCFPSCVCADAILYRSNGRARRICYVWRCGVPSYRLPYRGRPRQVSGSCISSLVRTNMYVYRTGGEQVVPGPGAQIAESLCARCVYYTVVSGRLRVGCACRVPVRRDRCPVDVALRVRCRCARRRIASRSFCSFISLAFTVGAFCFSSIGNSGRIGVCNRLPRRT